MKITSVTVKKIDKENSRMKGIASVLIDECFAVHDIRIIEGDNGLFIAMPSRQTSTGGYRDIAHPINSETRQVFEKEIIEAYEKEVLFSLNSSKVITREMLGSETLYKLQILSGVEAESEAIMSKSLDMSFAVDDEVYIGIAKEDLYYFDNAKDRIRDAAVLEGLYKATEGDE